MEPAFAISMARSRNSLAKWSDRGHIQKSKYSDNLQIPHPVGTESHQKMQSATLKLEKKKVKRPLSLYNVYKNNEMK